MITRNKQNEKKSLDNAFRYVDENCVQGARCSSVVRAFAHGAMGHWVDPSWGEPIELFLDPASAMCYIVCGMVHITEPLL